MNSFVNFIKNKYLSHLLLFASSGILFPAISHALPERPVNDRDVHMTERSQYTRPFIPPVQTSMDGRVGLGHKLQDGGGTFLRLQVPEKMDGAFIDSENGITIFAQEHSLADRSSQIRPLERSNHVGLCDPSGDPDSSIKNPRNCGGDDCYDLVVISSEVVDNRRRIIGTPINVRVENPKTARARISDVSVDTRNIRYSRFFPQGEFNAFFEPTTVADGRLLMVRQLQSSLVSWTDSRGNNRRTRADAIYLVNNNPDDFEACDVRQWNRAHPFTHAPYDRTINRRYGFAMQPFRDPEGRIIEEGTNVGTYPWIDKGGDVVTLTTVGVQLSESEYETRCVTSRCDSDEDSEEGGFRNGRVMVGLWTRGKMVLMDNLINNIDFNQRGQDSTHRNVRLYEGNNRQAFVRVGNGRDGTTADLPPGSSGSTSFFDSNENRFNFLPSMFPVTPADVTWIVSSGRGTDELSFDDYVNPNSFINSSMAQVQRFRQVSNRRTPELTDNIYVQDAVQNAATATRWRIPENGELFGDTRIEPVAMGGVKGKGLWLDGDNDGIRYQIRNQPRNILNSDWYYSLFVERRDGGEANQVIMSFPDGSAIRLRQNRLIQFMASDGSRVHSFTSPARFNPGNWVHLGFQLSNRNRTIDTYVNGYLVNSFDSTDSLFQLSRGQLTVGASPSNNQDFRGWIDEFKIFAENVNPEVACNHALGTIVGLRNNAPSAWVSRADGYPNFAHNRLTNILRDSGESIFSQYTCYNNYSDDYAAHLGNIPNGLQSMRDAINFPEGPIIHSQPRPDSSDNAFCLSCHTNDGLAGLGLDALEFRPGVLARDDERRQPMQPDPRVFGNIPAGWINGRPANSFVANPRNGYQIDRLIQR